MSGFLLDTNVLSELRKPEPNQAVVRWTEQTDEEAMFLSVLTMGEIRKGIARLPAGARRTRMETWFHVDLRRRFEKRILPIDEEVAARWGVIAAMAESRGKPVPVIDGLLAATAQHYNLVLVTRNTNDIAATGVPLMNFWV